MTVAVSPVQGYASRDLHLSADDIDLRAIFNGLFPDE
jgi:hypothetical protein